MKGKLVAHIANREPIGTLLIYMAPVISIAFLQPRYGLIGSFDETKARPSSQKTSPYPQACFPLAKCENAG